MNLMQKLGAAGALMATGVTSAFAALPASVGTTITGLNTDAGDLFDLVFPVVAAIVGMVIVIKLFKRFSNKI